MTRTTPSGSNESQHDFGCGGQLTITSEADAIWVGGTSRTIINGHVRL